MNQSDDEQNRPTQPPDMNGKKRWYGNNVWEFYKKYYFGGGWLKRAWSIGCFTLFACGLITFIVLFIVAAINHNL